MKLLTSQQKKSNLTTQIEIIRDQEPPDANEIPPALNDENNPLRALAELVERLEALEELPLIEKSGLEAAGGKQTNNSEHKECVAQVDQLLRLFQQQSAILRRLASKLN